MRTVYSVLDSSCGDLTWMPTFLSGRTDVFYTGFDLLPENIENHKKNFTDFTFEVITWYLLKKYWAKYV